MPEPDHVIGVDLGGTKILAGVVDRDGRIEEQREWRTPAESEEAIIAALDAAVDSYRDAGATAIGLGVPSRVDQETGRVFASVNLQLDDFPLRSHVEERSGLPVGVDNDGNAAALAEWTAGAGRGARTMVMLTLGTGVGGGFVLDGRLYRGLAEAGHMVVVHDGKPCPGFCSGRGHVEAYCTGGAATEVAREAFGPESNSRDLVRRADEGDERARELLSGIGGLLGSAIGSLANLFGAERAVVGGGFGIGAFGHLVDSALAVARREALSPTDEQLTIVRAELGTSAGLIGAGLIGFEALEA